jgi:4-hydroxy-4-methyl-2-oxoglutarate aldolase
MAQTTNNEKNKPSGNIPLPPTLKIDPALEQIRKRYLRLYAGLVFDILEGMGYPNQAVSHKIMPLTLDMKLSGFAFTVKGCPTAVKDQSIRYRRLNAIKEMTYPCIEVRDAGTTQFNVALYGELTSTTARAHGSVGALVDGGTRDSGMIIEMGFPVFAKYRCPVEAFGRVMTLDHQVPILVSGELTETLIVNPGDYIFGDLDGVLVIPKALTMKVLEEAEKIMGVENKAREEFKTGADPIEVFKKYRRL